MPLGYDRLNVRRQSPNEKIVFIKALEGPNKDTSEDFLERLAAICAPIMRVNYLSVVSLEEFEPNREFWGRNFNAGEVIQIVLRSPSNGNWLPFNFVQMVMMHELAHCKQMNHSRAFWMVRNQYATELKDLWARNYTGDGFWGRGQTLYEGQYTHDNMPMTEDMPQHLCGGVYRSGGRRKRKRKGEEKKETLSYTQRNQRRIEKKFGRNGMALGEDEDVRTGLEKKKVAAKPRVAGSLRGRELRAAAALARFNVAEDLAVKEELESSETDDESDSAALPLNGEAVDFKGNKILDSHGHGMVKVCEDEKADTDSNALHELEELGRVKRNTRRSLPEGSTKERSKSPQVKVKEEEISTASESADENTKFIGPGNATQTDRTTLVVCQSIPQNFSHDINNQQQSTTTSTYHTVTTQSNTSRASPTSIARPSALTSDTNLLHLQLPAEVWQHIEDASSDQCSVCSLNNPSDALTCAACAHVLHPERLPHHWLCQSSVCHGSKYINAADNGRCGICGALKMKG